MSFMDKVKAQADQAMAKAQAGMAQGHAKIDDVQAARNFQELLRNLGAAVWAAKRHGGSEGDVDAAMATLDEFAANHPDKAVPTGAPAAPSAAESVPTATEPVAAPPVMPPSPPVVSAPADTPLGGSMPPPPA